MSVCCEQGIFYGIHAANASWLGAANEQAMMEYIPRGQNDARAQFNSSEHRTAADPLQDSIAAREL